MTESDIVFIARSFPGVIETPHRKGMRAFKIGGRIFATLNPAEKRCCLRLSEVDQSVFSGIDHERIHSVPKAWGRYGWTLFYYEHLDPELLQDALRCAFLNMASVKWATKLDRDHYQ